MKVDLLWYALPISFLVGSVLSWLVYRTKLNRKQARLLLVLRALGWSMLVFLLFKPSFSLLTNHEEKPKIRLFRDASESATAYSRIEALAIKRQIEAEFNNEIDLDITAFGQELISESWDSLMLGSKLIQLPPKNEKNVNSSKESKSVNSELPLIRISQTLGSETRLDGVNQAILNLKNEQSTQAAIVISDGIMNAGSSPLNGNVKSKKPVLVIGVGDSSVYPDASVAPLISNNEVFLGNSTQIETVIDYQNVSSNSINVELLENGRVVQTVVKKTALGKKGKAFVSFDYTGKLIGVQSLQVRCFLAEDKNPNNNFSAKSINVIDRKKKVFIIYGKPHPDIKAMVESLSSTIQNEVVVQSEFEVQNQTPTQSLQEADLVVLHGIENVGTFEAIVKQKLPHWVFVNTPTAMVFANKNSSVLVGNISRITTFQTVGVSLNEDFSLFQWGNANPAKLQNIWGGISAAVVKLKPSSNSNIQLKQVWNSTVTDFPLSSVNSNSEVPSFWFWGEGIWKARLNEYRKSQSTEQFDGWVNTSLQWLGNNPSKNKGLEIVTPSDQAQLGVPYRFKVIQFDQAGNKSNKENLMAKVVDQNGKEFVLPLIRVNQEYVGSFLPEADGMVKLMIENPTNKIQTAEKRILVSAFSQEQRTLKADFELLRNWAKKLNGNFISSHSIKTDLPKNNQLVQADYLLNNQRSSVVLAIKQWINKNKINQIRIIEETRTVGLREWIIYLFLVCGIFAVEWVLRKRWGLES